MRYATFVALTLVGVTGCATMQAAATRSDEQALAAAGFHMQLADTPERVAELQSLPPRKLVSRPQNGAILHLDAAAVCEQAGKENARSQRTSRHCSDS